MTVSDLIDILENFDPDLKVLVARDGFGSYMASIVDYQEGSYESDIQEFTPFDEEDIDTVGVPCVVLFPES